MVKYLTLFLCVFILASCGSSENKTPSAPAKPIVVVASLAPDTNEISGPLGEYLRIVDKSYDAEANDREYNLTLTVEAIKPTGPINTGGWMCAEMSLTLLNDNGMPISGFTPATLFEGNNELRNILVSGSGQAFLKFKDYEPKADSLIKTLAKSFMISGRPLTDHIDPAQVSKTETTSLEEEESTSNSSSASTSSSCEQWLKEYDSWVTKYIAFMRKYKKNPADMSMLSDYSRLTSEMTKWANGNSDCDDAASIARMTEIANRLNRELASM
jgi:hypothetical protein